MLVITTTQSARHALTTADHSLKAKLSQNHPDANREAVIAKLGAQSTDDARATAALMRAALAVSHPQRTPAGD